MKKLSLTLAATLVLALIAGSVFAWGPGHGRGMMWNGGGRGACQGYGNFGNAGFADLTAEQREQLTALQQQFVDDTYQLRSEQVVKRQQIRMLLETSSPDRAELDKLYADLDDAQKQIRSKRVDFQIEAKKIAPEFQFARGFGKGRGGKRFGGGQNCPWYGNTPENGPVTNN